LKEKKRKLKVEKGGGVDESGGECGGKTRTKYCEHACQVTIELSPPFLGLVTNVMF